MGSGEWFSTTNKTANSRIESMNWGWMVQFKLFLRNYSQGTAPLDITPSELVKLCKIDVFIVEIFGDVRYNHPLCSK